VLSVEVQQLCANGAQIKSSATRQHGVPAQRTKTSNSDDPKTLKSLRGMERPESGREYCSVNQLLSVFVNSLQAHTPSLRLTFKIMKTRSLLQFGRSVKHG